MSWDEVCNLFEGIYMNWDPGLFQHHLDFHGYVCTLMPPRRPLELVFCLMFVQDLEGQEFRRQRAL
jgi:hypothetical protein